MRYICDQFCISSFRTHNSKFLEEQNLRLFITKSEEMLGIKQIFADEKEMVFRNAANFSIVLNAIAQISQKSERSHSRLKTKVNKMQHVTYDHTYVKISFLLSE